MSALAQPCPEEALLCRFLERLALPEERDAVSSHLETCASCRQTLALLAEDLPALEEPAGDEGLEADRLGPYRLGRRLGAGAMGEVFLAVDTRLGREVAIKHVRRRLASSQAQRLLLEEARGLARLNHPNIVSIFDVNVTGERVWLAMEYVDGLTLGGWLEQGHGSAEIVEVFVQVTKGLAAAHERGVIHRDVKPANVLVGRDGRVRVSDFGMAMVDGVMHISGGTPAYMSPEQRAGEEITPAADQYSLGVALAEALSGARPVAGQPIAWPSAVRQPLRAVVERALQRLPAQRFASMRELGAALEASGTSLWRQGGRRGLLLAGALAVVATAVAFGLFFAATAISLRVAPPPQPSVGTVLRQTLPSVVLVVASTPDQPLRFGAGLLVPRSGRHYVLTTAGLVRGAQALGVLREDPDARRYSAQEGGAQRYVFEHEPELVGARLVRTDPQENLAVMDLPEDRGPAPEPSFAPLSEAPAEGDEVTAIGHPDGVAWSSLSGTLTGVHERSLLAGLTPSDGLSGGVLVSGRGQILGLVTSDSSAHGPLTAVPTAALLALVDGVSAPVKMDRSTPEKAVLSCLRAFELGDAAGWVDCIAVDSHWRLHQETVGWTLAHATPSEAFTIRWALEHGPDDYTSKEHALREVAANYQQLFSHDPPAVKAASNPYLTSALGGSLDYPDDDIERLRHGARVEKLTMVGSVAWALLAWQGEGGVVRHSSQVLVQCGPQWCLRDLPFPEEAAWRPDGYPPTASWNALIKERGEATLLMWRRYLEQRLDSWW